MAADPHADGQLGGGPADTNNATSTTSSSGGSGSGGAAAGGIDADDSGDDVDDDDDILGPNLMGQLASSLRAALHARAGAREASPSPGPEELPAGPSGQKLGLGSDPNAIRWAPEVRQAREVAAPALQRTAPGSGGDKEKGLSKQLLAPPRIGAAGPSNPAKEAAKQWFQLPATKVTDEVKRELRLLRLRGAYDPKRFYKSFDETKFPKHCQIGTVVDNPQDFYSSRLAARERGSSLTDELLADPAVRAVRKKRYAKLQEEAKRHQKVKKRKTDNPRNKAKPKRPKH